MPRHAIHLGTAWEPPTASTPAWVRRFGRPAGLEPGDRLVLVCEAAESVDLWRAATLNGHGLEWSGAAAGVIECDVTAVIVSRNRLVVPAYDGQERDGPGTRVTTPQAWGRLSLVVVSD
jgi:hypothetical protein